MSALHLVAGWLCVTASVVMLVRASTRATRMAHAAMLAAMLAMALAVHSLAVLLLCTAGLLAAAVVVATAGSDRTARVCSVDLAGAAVMMIPMAVPLLVATTAHAAPAAPMEHGMHTGANAAMPGVAGSGVAFAAAVVAVIGLLGWVVIRRVVAPNGQRPAGGGAAAAMMLAMATMAVA